MGMYMTASMSRRQRLELWQTRNQYKCVQALFSCPERRWKWKAKLPLCLNIMPRKHIWEMDTQFYIFLTLALDKGEQSASYFSHPTPEYKHPSTFWISLLLCHRTVLKTSHLWPSKFCSHNKWFIVENWYSLVQLSIL